MAQSYDQAFFDQIEADSLRAARIIVPLVLELVEARSVIDLGCGRGTWLKAFAENGVAQITGMDGDYVQRDRLLIPQEAFQAHNLANPIEPKSRFDLAISMETAEHLPPARADGFVSDLCALAPVVLFSAAIPQQGGVGHVNEQWQSYWAGKFQGQGYEAVDAIRPQIWRLEGAGTVYAQNAILYCNPEVLAGSESLRQWRDKTHDKMLDLVHPDTFRSKDTLSLPDHVTIGRVLRALPFAIRKAAARFYHRRLKRRKP